MQEVTFTLQTITPLFLAGADQTKAELRAPSFRGLMRYWQRALVGGLVGTDQNGFKQVMQAETEVFGATDTGSAVAIKISGVSGEPREFTEPISTRVGGSWQATGKGYLLWSMARMEFIGAPFHVRAVRALWLRVSPRTGHSVQKSLPACR